MVNLCGRPISSGNPYDDPFRSDLRGETGLTSIGGEPSRSQTILAAPPSGAVAYEAAPKFKHSRRTKAEGVYRGRLDRCGPMPSAFTPHSLIAEIELLSPSRSAVSSGPRRRSSEDYTEALPLSSSVPSKAQTPAGICDDAWPPRRPRRSEKAWLRRTAW